MRQTTRILLWLARVELRRLRRRDGVRRGLLRNARGALLATFSIALAGALLWSASEMPRDATAHARAQLVVYWHVAFATLVIACRALRSLLHGLYESDSNLVLLLAPVRPRALVRARYVQTALAVCGIFVAGIATTWALVAGARTESLAFCTTFLALSLAYSTCLAALCLLVVLHMGRRGIPARRAQRFAAVVEVALAAALPTGLAWVSRAPGSLHASLLRAEALLDPAPLRAVPWGWWWHALNAAREGDWACAWLVILALCGATTALVWLALRASETLSIGAQLLDDRGVRATRRIAQASPARRTPSQVARSFDVAMLRKDALWLRRTPIVAWHIVATSVALMAVPLAVMLVRGAPMSTALLPAIWSSVLAGWVTGVLTGCIVVRLEGAAFDRLLIWSGGARRVLGCKRAVALVIAGAPVAVAALASMLCTGAPGIAIVWGACSAVAGVWCGAPVGIYEALDIEQLRWRRPRDVAGAASAAPASPVVQWFLGGALVLHFAIEIVSLPFWTPFAQRPLTLPMALAGNTVVLVLAWALGEHMQRRAVRRMRALEWTQIH